MMVTLTGGWGVEGGGSPLRKKIMHRPAPGTACDLTGGLSHPPPPRPLRCWTQGNRPPQSPGSPSAARPDSRSARALWPWPRARCRFAGALFAPAASRGVDCLNVEAPRPPTTLLGPRRSDMRTPLSRPQAPGKSGVLSEGGGVRGRWAEFSLRGGGSGGGAPPPQETLGCYRRRRRRRNHLAEVVRSKPGRRI